MLQLLGGVMMMAGGGMVSACGVSITRRLVRRPAGAIGEALNSVYPPEREVPLPGDLVVLLDALP